MGTSIISGGTPVVSGGTPIVSGGTPIASGGTPVIGGGGGSGPPPLIWTLVAEVSVVYPAITSPSINTTGANLIVLTVVHGANAMGTPPVSDSNSNAWIHGVNSPIQNGCAEIFYCINPIVGPGHTFSYNYGFYGPTLTAMAFYVPGSAAADQTANTTGIGTATSLQVPITPSVNSALITGVVNSSQANVVGIDTGFNILSNTPYVLNQQWGQAAAYLMQSIAAAITPTWTFASQPVVTSGSCMMSFKYVSQWHLLAQVDTGGTTTTSAPIDTTGANLLVIVTSRSTTVPVLSDSYNNQWFFAAVGQGTVLTDIYYCIHPTVGPGHTFTNTSNNSALFSFSVLAYAGPSVMGLDLSRIAGTTAGTSIQLPSSTPTANDSLLLTVLTTNNATMNVDSNFITLLTRTATYTKAIASLLQPVPVPLAPTWMIPSSAYMAAALVSFKPVTPSPIWTLLKQTFAANPTATTPPVDTTGANLIVITTSWTATAPVFNDSYGNTWIQGPQNVISPAYKRLYYCIHPTVGTGHTFTNGAASVLNSSFAVLAFRGPATTITYNQNNVATFNTSQTSFQATPLTPTASNALIISNIVATAAVSQIQAVDSGFTIAVNQSGVAGGQSNDAVSYFVQGTAAAVAPRWSFAAASASGTVIMVSFIGS